MEIGERKF